MSDDTLAECSPDKRILVQYLAERLGTDEGTALQYYESRFDRAPMEGQR